jgi:hypothetical protein
MVHVSSANQTADRIPALSWLLAFTLGKEHSISAWIRYAPAGVNDM